MRTQRPGIGIIIIILDQTIFYNISLYFSFFLKEWDHGSRIYKHCIKPRNHVLIKSQTIATEGKLVFFSYYLPPQLCKVFFFLWLLDVVHSVYNSIIFRLYWVVVHLNFNYNDRC